MRLTRDEIVDLIPHAGRMVLLDQVVDWDDDRIVCTSTMHQDRGNPLLVAGHLSSVCGIEFAAQAMAVHGALVAQAHDAAFQGCKPRAGFLASVRSVQMDVLRLDDVRSVLTIEAEREAGDERNVLYRFEVRAGAEMLVSGRAAVVLQMADDDGSP
jgi:predicted hotdog family 3-hydroxylacyl-ACP dehydratase